MGAFVLIRNAFRANEFWRPLSWINDDQNEKGGRVGQIILGCLGFFGPLNENFPSSKLSS